MNNTPRAGNVGLSSKIVRRTLAERSAVRTPDERGFPHMLVGYMRVSTDSDRQVLDLQRDALVAVGVDERHLFEDRVSGSRGDRTGLAKALAFIKSGDCLVVYAVTVSVQCHQ